MLLIISCTRSSSSLVCVVNRVDDIEDSSILRRGIPVAHSIFGIASTINSANYVYFLGLEKILTLDHPKVTKILFILYKC